MLDRFQRARKARVPGERGEGSTSRARSARRLLGGVGVGVYAALALWLVACDPGVESPLDAVAAGSDRTDPAGEVRRQSGLDVLLVTVDTLRADALGSYGRAGAGTPWMDRLAETGVRFESAYAHNTLTLPSHANILTGLYPQEHGVRDNSGFRLSSEITTLASLLRDQGYRTGAFVSAFPLDSRFGLSHGFDLYEDSFVDAASRPAFLEQERAGVETVRLATEWLAAADARPTFAWVHLYEPHFPYAPPEPLASRFVGEPYQGDVAAADAALAPLLEPVLAMGEGSDTLVILTSDHGESLGEHGEATHGIFAYEGVLRVPLILHQPRLLPARVVSSPARHVDLMPTILDALGLSPPPGLDGESLLPAAVGQLHEATVYFEALSGRYNRGWAPLYGVVDRGWKYIDLPIAELYDLTRDPAETENLATAEPERLAEARAVLEPLRRRDADAPPAAESEEVRRRLATLGYLQVEPEAGSRVYTADDDPKNLIELDSILRDVVTLHEAGELAAALERCRELVRRRPDMRIALLHLAQLERQSGDLDRGIRALEAAFSLHPEDTSTLALLAGYLTQAGRADEAVEVTQPHVDLREPDVEVLLTRGLALARLGRALDAFDALERAAEQDPTNAKVSVYRGTLYLMGGQRDRARAEYERALTLNPRTAAAHSSLAILAIEDGSVEESLARWRDAVASDPRELSKLVAIGTSLWNAGRPAEARPLLELFLRSSTGRTLAREREAVRRLLATNG